MIRFLREDNICCSEFNGTNKDNMICLECNCIYCLSCSKLHSEKFNHLPKDYPKCLSELIRKKETFNNLDDIIKKIKNLDKNRLIMTKNFNIKITKIVNMNDKILTEFKSLIDKIEKTKVSNEINYATILELKTSIENYEGYFEVLELVNELNTIIHYLRGDSDAFIVEELPKDMIESLFKRRMISDFMEDEYKIFFNEDIKELNKTVNELNNKNKDLIKEQNDISLINNKKNDYTLLADKFNEQLHKDIEKYKPEIERIRKDFDAIKISIKKLEDRKKKLESENEFLVNSINKNMKRYEENLKQKVQYENILEDIKSVEKILIEKKRNLKELEHHTEEIMKSKESHKAELNKIIDKIVISKLMVKKIKNLFMIHKDITQKIYEFKVDIDFVKVEISQFYKKWEETKKEIANDIAGKKSELDKIQKTIEDSKNEYQQLIIKTNNKENELKMYNEHCKDLIPRINEYKKEHAKLQEEISKLQDRSNHCKKLEEKIQEREKNCKKLKEYIQNYKNTINSISKKASLLRHKNNEMEKEYNELVEMCKELKVRKNKLIMSIDSEESKRFSEKLKHNTLELSKLTEKINTLEKEEKNLNSKIDEFMKLNEKNIEKFGSSENNSSYPEIEHNDTEFEIVMSSEIISSKQKINKNVFKAINNSKELMYKMINLTHFCMEICKVIRNEFLKKISLLIYEFNNVKLQTIAIKRHPLIIYNEKLSYPHIMLTKMNGHPLEVKDNKMDELIRYLTHPLFCNIFALGFINVKFKSADVIRNFLNNLPNVSILDISGIKTDSQFIGGLLRVLKDFRIKCFIMNKAAIKDNDKTMDVITNLIFETNIEHLSAKQVPFTLLLSKLIENPLFKTTKLKCLNLFYDKNVDEKGEEHSKYEKTFGVVLEYLKIKIIDKTTKIKSIVKFVGPSKKIHKCPYIK